MEIIYNNRGLSAEASGGCNTDTVKCNITIISHEYENNLHASEGFYYTAHILKGEVKMK
jgi:hypothetical protein